MDRLTRQNLKHDKFADEVGQSVEFLSEHKSDVLKYGIAAVVVAVLVAGYYLYSNHQQTVRQAALAAALQIEDGTVGPQAQPPLPQFATDQDKKKARTAAFSDVASKYHGTQEGAVAQMYLAAALADEGKLAEAEKSYRDVADSAPKEYASVAKLALANILVSEGKNADAEKVFRDLVANPTTFVSKEEAQVALGEFLLGPKPDEGKKLLEGLRGGRSVVSRAAVAALSKPQN